MSIKKIKIIPLLLVFLLVISQCLVCFAIDYDVTTYPADNTSCTYNEKFCYSDSNPYMFSYSTISSNAEVVGYCVKNYNYGTEVVEYDVVHFISLGSFNSSVVQNVEWSADDKATKTGNYASSSISLGGEEYAYVLYNNQVPYMSQGANSVINYNSMYIFDSQESAVNYLKTGDMSGLKHNKSKTYDSEKIYLENFRVVYHDSNVLDNCYVEFKYTLPEGITNNISNAKLIVDIVYDMDVNILRGAYNGAMGDAIQQIEIPLEYNDTGFKYYLNSLYSTPDIGLLNELLGYDDYFKGAMLGEEIYFDFSGLGLDLLVEITKSTVYFDVTPVIEATCGMQNNAQVDLLNPSNTSYYSSKPNEKGEYTTNNDYQQSDGYYTTVVTPDGQGNPTYNYYYYDNSKHYSYEIDPDTDVDIDTDIPIGGGSGGSSDSVVTILWGNALEIQGNIDLNGDFSGSGSGGGSGGSGGDSNVNVNTGDNINLTIEDDDYTDTALREDLKDGFGLLDDSTTPEYGDGFISVASSFFNSIDPDASQILMFSLSCVCAVSILRSVFRR